MCRYDEERRHYRERSYFSFIFHGLITDYIFFHAMILGSSSILFFCAHYVFQIVFKACLYIYIYIFLGIHKLLLTNVFLNVNFHHLFGNLLLSFKLKLQNLSKR